MSARPSLELTRAQLFIAVVCVMSGLKILFFSSALPFFPLDEELHFDAIHKFATGYTKQTALPGFDHETAEIIELYHSPEFLRVPEPGRPFMPLSSWCRPSMDHLPQELQYLTDAWTTRIKNIEIDAPPAYYTIAAIWYKLGRLLGASGAFLLYWLRFLNAAGYVLFVLFSWMFIRECYPENNFLLISVPIFLLVFPQDCFLFLIPNSLSAPFMSLTFLLLAKLYKNPGHSVWLYLLAGFVAASTALLTFGNFPVAFCLIVASWFLAAGRGAERNARILKTLALLAAAGIPVGIWLLRNYLVLGTWSGSKAKQEYLTWTVKPLSQIVHHPFFTWQGFAYFVSTLSRNFWRGEVHWGATPRTAWIDPVYLWLSIIFCLIFLIQRYRSAKTGQGFAFGDALSITLVVTSVLFLVLISLPFDFGTCVYPSRAHPYFVSGRLIIGALLPFLILFLGGLQVLCGWISAKLNPLYVAMPLAALVFITETILFLPILSSRFTLISFLLGRSCS